MFPPQEIRTSRLRIIGLSPALLRLCRRGRVHMERALGLVPLSAGNVLREEALSSALEEMIGRVEAAGTEGFWCTNWEIVLGEENRIIGGLAFYGVPGPEKEVEIGYILQPEYRGRGYASEALRAMIEWCRRKFGVAVVAETEKTNGPSQGAALAAGMIPAEEREHTFLFRSP